MNIKNAMKIIYNLSISKKEITTSNLNKNGIDEDMINKLIDNKIIKLINEENYKIDKEKLNFQLIDYSNKNNLYDEKNNFIHLYELLLYYIKKNKYDDAIKILNFISKNTKEDIYFKDYNLDLLLISQLTKLDKKYVNYLGVLENNDYLIEKDEKSSENDIKLENEAREAIIIKNDTYYARELFYYKTRKNENNLLILRYKVIKLLLAKINSKRQNNKMECINLVKEEKYQEAVDLLNDMKDRIGLSNEYSKSLSILENLIEAKKYMRPINVTQLKDLSIASLYESNDYAKILEHIKRNNDKSLPLLELVLDKTIEENNRIKEIQKSLEKIKRFIIKKNKKELEIEIDKYLKLNEKSNYKQYILSIIKLFNNDNYDKLMYMIENLNEKEISINITDYIQDFYVSLEKFEFKSAKAYLDIVKSANDNIKLPFNIDDLKNAYKTKKKMYYKDIDK